MYELGKKGTGKRYRKLQSCFIGFSCPSQPSRYAGQGGSCRCFSDDLMISVRREPRSIYSGRRRFFSLYRMLLLHKVSKNFQSP